MLCVNLIFMRFVLPEQLFEASYVLQLQYTEKVSTNFIIKMTESDISLRAANNFKLFFPLFFSSPKLTVSITSSSKL